MNKSKIYKLCKSITLFFNKGSRGFFTDIEIKKQASENYQDIIKNRGKETIQSLRNEVDNGNKAAQIYLKNIIYILKKIQKNA